MSGTTLVAPVRPGRTAAGPCRCGAADGSDRQFAIAYEDHGEPLRLEGEILAGHGRSGDDCRALVARPRGRPQ